ncbi:NAD(P)/FAD-dependent oxidoreductase [Solicola gregarius]|uniref:FAD-binding oxidoreductase n=1 Tax=Solicola gregarius TaxID=2908642 RepID=A0AA46YN70_9ACTN|nr:FAD-dependent oxidoreductase [Solicola gregarius]UYM07181.1 FAD-binding oxidoreductase [Solicola gregarius]
MMSELGRNGATPRRVAVVGGGMVGLSTAWFLQDRGVEVTVYERDHVAAGSSWGNAGWLTPALTVPLPEPSVLTYGVKAVLSPSSPVYVPVSADPGLLRFLSGFTRASTARRWRRSLRAYAPVSRRALESFDLLAKAGVDSPTRETEAFLACFTDAKAREHLVHELDEVRASGQDVAYDLLNGDEARRITPALSERVGAAVRLRGQRFINPPEYVAALAASVRERGGTILEGTGVDEIRDDRDGVVLDLGGGRTERHDAVVAATGTWLGKLARPFGVRKVVQAGRGYSFTVPADVLPENPVYLPDQRVACTPLGDRLRVAGMMEFRRPDVPIDPRRIEAIVEAARPMFGPGVDFDDRRSEWVGSRPCTADGLPLIGPTRSPRVYAAGGHGMWGIVLGPLTGQLIAEAITSGRTPAELTPFDPLR